MTAQQVISQSIELEGELTRSGNPDLERALRDERQKLQSTVSQQNRDMDAEEFTAHKAGAIATQKAEVERLIAMYEAYA